jgi:multiple sugar transport system ATP-binding protein
VAGLTFRGVRKDYGSVPALRGLDLEAADGEFLVVVGPSGCGKTTALRTAAGLEEVTEGSILIGSRDVTRLPPSKRNVSMVFQSYALFPHLSVGENIGFGLAVRRVPKAEADERVRSAAEVVGCGELLDRKPFQLSGGERQRVALARALVREPDVFLLDEPLSNLDAQLRVYMRAELKRLHHRLEKTMVYVTHDQVEALTLGERVAVLRDGVLQQVGPPDGVYRRPVNRFVATFIGSPAMNVLPAAMNQDRLHAGPFAFRPPRGAERLNGKKLELGIRPEDLQVFTEGSGPGAPAVVQVVEAAGNETFLHLEANGHAMIARTGSEVRPAVGTTVRLDVPRRKAYLFDADSGETLVQQG